MNREETLKILAVLKVAYPSSFRNMGNEDLQATVNLWAVQFADDSYDMVFAAVNALIATRVEGYPPTIGAVKEKLHFISNPNVLTEAEAWSLIERCIADGAYHAREQWEKLPPTIQKLTTPSEIRQWAISENFNKSVVSSNFMRSYRERVKQETEMSMMPKKIQNYISSIGDKLAIERKGDEAD